MAIIDMIFKIDAQHKLEKVFCLGDTKEWLKEHYWSEFIGEKINYVLGTSLKTEGGIIEIKNKVFKYQWVNEAYIGKEFKFRRCKEKNNGRKQSYS